MSNTPRHIAIIPDGNRRWAREHKFAVVSKGHEAGAQRFGEIMRESFSAGVEYLTLWAASIDNFKKRPQAEITVLVRLLIEELDRIGKSPETEKYKVRVRIIGEGAQLAQHEELTKAIAAIEKMTAENTKHHLTILFGYDGQQEMLKAIEKLRGRSGKIEVDDVHKALTTSELPPVDLVIRTGGEPHWSAGFMMWHTANSQFYFTEKYWPDFSAQDLNIALKDFSARERRAGK
jgi:undecaprenyl diphosphate synthase